MLAAELLRGQEIRFTADRPWLNARSAAICRTIWTRAGWRARTPIAAVRASYFEGDTLTHRDFLGALMGCGVKRETVGDIYVAEGRCDFLVTREVLPYLLQNFLSAGRTKLHVERIALTDVSVPEQKIRHGPRYRALPCGSTALFPPAFPSAAARLRSISAPENAKLNYAPCVKGDKQTAEGDVITVRGLGKIRLDTIGSNTKKGRIWR